MRVFLSGFMAAGKSTVGRALAPLLDAPFVDLDREIESAAGASIADIFAERGEGAFRELEGATLRRMLVAERLVMALGGGTVLDDQNRSLLRAAGVLVWLNTRRSTILDRLEGEGSRPLNRSREEAASLLDVRTPIYRDCDLEIRPEPGEEADSVARRIAASL